MKPEITDKHIKVQALQHLLIHYENKYKKYNGGGREDVLEIIELYISKIRRTIISVLEEDNKKVNKPIEFY